MGFFTDLLINTGKQAGKELGEKALYSYFKSREDQKRARKMGNNYMQNKKY